MKYILAQDKSRFSLWQIDTAVSSLLKLDIRREDIYVLLGNYGYSKQYKTLYSKYRGVNFIEYRATIDLSYMPAIKPYLLGKFFEQYRELQKEQWLLMDCDNILTKKLRKFKKGKLYVSNSDQDSSMYIFDNVEYEMFFYIYEKCYSLKKILKSKNAGVWGSWSAYSWAMAFGVSKWGLYVKQDKRLDFSLTAEKSTSAKAIVVNASVTGDDAEGLFNKGLYKKSLPSLNLDIDDNFVSSVYYKFVKER